MEQLLEFAGNHPLLVAALMISFFVVVFSEIRRKATGMVAVSPADAVALLNKVIADYPNTSEARQAERQSEPKRAYRSFLIAAVLFILALLAVVISIPLALVLVHVLGMIGPPIATV